MSLLYADTSALARVYVADESGHAELKALLFADQQPLVTSEIARLELASAMRAASRTGRVRNYADVLRGIDAHFAQGGPIDAIDLRPRLIFPLAHRLIIEHGLRTLDAVHLAVCVEECPALAGGDEIVFVTRDADQAKAARALGLEVR